MVYFHVADGIRDEKSEPLWTTEAWYTLNAIPKGRAGTVGTPREQNVLTAAEKDAGWKSLFDGKTLDAWQGFGGKPVPTGWHAIDGELRRVEGGGDLLSKEIYGDFEVSLEWKIAEGSNSGLIWRVGDDEAPGWRTGPEMQILDNKHHPDGRLASTSAGACYALIAPDRDVSLAPNRWNTARLVAKGSKISYWLNNENVANFDVASAEWKDLVAKSKFKNFPNFGKLSKGRLMLQDHGDDVAFRNIKIRELK